MILMLLSIFVIVAPCTQAQKVADSELKSYVIALDSIEVLKNGFVITMNKISQGNEKISVL